MQKNTIETCISQISDWMSINRLTLNSDKTEFMLLGTRQQLAKMQYNSVSIEGDVIQARTCVRNLGVYMDSEMKMNVHVQHVVHVGYAKLCEIASFRKYITVYYLESANTLLTNSNAYRMQPLD